jgi:hypothetical protein
MTRSNRGRRAALVLLGVLCALGAGPAAQAQRLDLSRPEDATKASRRIQCSLQDGVPVTFSWRGGVYSRVPGERDRHLFNVEGMNIRQCQTVQDPKRGYGYRMVSREILLYLDPETNQVLRTWTNPWTNKQVEVVHVANDPVNQPPAFAHDEKGQPARFRGTIANGRIWQSFEVPLFYRNPLGGDYQEYVGGTYHAMEMFTFFVDEADLLDTSHEPRTVTVGWSRISNFLPWMEMGDKPGVLVFTTVGKRLNDPKSLPEVMRNEIAASYPDYVTPPPLDDTRPNETSWTYIKKLIDKKRAGKTPGQ